MSNSFALQLGVSEWAVS